jgi:dTDP-glucose 4,6-dehydratase
MRWHYAGNLENIVDIKEPNYTFIKGDIVDASFIDACFTEHQFDGVLHLAAESRIVLLRIRCLFL